jgi:uncharacterized protein YceK
MRTSILSLVVTLLFLAGCSSTTRQDIVPSTFTVKNSSNAAISVKLFSGRTHSIGDLPPTLTDLEFTQNQVNPGASREAVPVSGYIDGDSVYFQVYGSSNGVNGLVYSKLYNNIELIRQKKLLVYQSP